MLQHQYETANILMLLDLEDEDICVTDVSEDNQQKLVTLETRLTPHYCPACGFRMYSRGIKKRVVNHPILQDTYHLSLILKQRRWRCSNPKCRYEVAEAFRFVNKNRRTTNATDMLIILEYQKLSMTTAAIAEKFHVSDSYAHDVFDRYVKLDRLPLTGAVSVDEVHVEMDTDCKYALVIQDFITGDPIDMLPSRRTNVTEPYFAKIPPEERNGVKYLISDMYNPYIAFVGKYFPNAVPVVDAFHVIQWIINELDKYLRELLKKYRKRDEELEAKMSEEQGRVVHLPKSKEVYMLQKYRWLILTNQSEIRYSNKFKMDPCFHRLMCIYDYEDFLFNLDPTLRELRELKELYVSFNQRNAGNPVNAAKEIDVLIDTYDACGQPIFERFSSLLRRYKEPIINSFVMIEKINKTGTYKSRLSNGPIESMNRKVKDLKRNGRGFRNFEHFRNRFLYAVRSNPVLNSTTTPQEPNNNSVPEEENGYT
ncbi:MAG: ISL3 family transposase [Butyrivibrio sp.]|nr:ISL3 family transposase [Butyrivibrio sp.]